MAVVMVAGLNLLSLSAVEPGTEPLFPIELPRADWVHFRGAGFSEPVCGVVCRLSDTVTNGMPLGGNELHRTVVSEKEWPVKPVPQRRWSAVVNS